MHGHFEPLYVVHRLDYNTSGVVLFARTSDAHKLLSRMFENGEIEKTYQALTKLPRDMEAIIDAPIRERISRPGTYEVHPSGKPSRTSFKVQSIFGLIALLDITLHTGRTHQIRVHLRHYGSPLLVDHEYGQQDAFFLSSIKHIKLGKGELERPLLKRSSLHASKVSFLHPITNNRVTIEAPWPKDFKAVVYQLNKAFN